MGMQAGMVPGAGGFGGGSCRRCRQRHVVDADVKMVGCGMDTEGIVGCGMDMEGMVSHGAAGSSCLHGVAGSSC